MSRAQTPTLLYRGVDNEGRERAGRAHDRPLSEWMEQRFRAGWQWIQVRDKRTGEQIARLGKHPRTGERGWWVKSWWTDGGAR